MNEQELPCQGIWRIGEYFVKAASQRTWQPCSDIVGDELHRIAVCESMHPIEQCVIGVQHNDSFPCSSLRQNNCEQVIVAE
jgi:hypothetical protein